MHIDNRLAVVAIISIGGVVAGAYTLGQMQSMRPGATSDLPSVAKGVSGPLAPDAQLPPNHPVLRPAPKPAIAKDGSTARKSLPAGKASAPAKPGINAAFTHFRVGNRNVKDILLDGSVVWVGTSGGVIRYDTTTRNHRVFDVRNGLLSNGVFHISKLDERIAVGTYGGGLSLYDPRADKWEYFNVPQGLGDAFVYDLLQARNGDIWIATWSGVNRVRGGDLGKREQWDLFTVENTEGGLPNDWVYGLAEGKDGEIWLATEGGLARFVNGRWQNWNHAKGLGAPYESVKNDLQFNTDPAQFSSHHARQKEEQGLSDITTAYNPNYIVSLLVDGNGTVWAGTWGGGLARFDGTVWRNYTTADGLPANHVFMLHQDTKGRLWVGTSNGLARLERNGRFSMFTTKHGLFSNPVFAMATAGDDRVWVGSFGGVAWLRLP